MADNQMRMPGPFGGLVRYDEEYSSRFMISPAAVIGFAVVIVAFFLAMKIFWPTG